MSSLKGTLLYRLRLAVAYTRWCLLKIYLWGSRLCHQYNAVDKAHHILCHCRLYASERSNQLRSVSIPTTASFTFEDALSTWNSDKITHSFTKAVLKFCEQEVYMNRLSFTQPSLLLTSHLWPSVYHFSDMMWHTECDVVSCGFSFVRQHLFLVVCCVVNIFLSSGFHCIPLAK